MHRYIAIIVFVTSFTVIQSPRVMARSRALCRIVPPRFLAERRMRRLNQG